MNKLPIIIFAALLIMCAIPLWKGKNPTVVESAMIGRAIPVFTLPSAVEGKKGFTSADLLGKPAIVNVFASWCESCQQEQVVLGEIATAEQVPVYGIDYKDTPANLSAWLQQLGDPYIAIGADTDAHVSIDWGVYGVPETFIVDAKGVIRYKQVGAVTEEVYREKFKPLLAELRK